MTSANTYSSPVFSHSAAQILTTAELLPTRGGYRLRTASIRATWPFFAGPGEAAVFCLSHGVLKTSSPLPKGIKRGNAKECLKNAGRLALAHPDKFTYCEGWAQMPINRGLTTYHAWCLDRQGKVVDPTWEHQKGAEYLGLPIKASVLREQILATKEWGFFRHGIYLPKGFSANPEEFLENSFIGGS